MGVSLFESEADECGSMNSHGLTVPADMASERAARASERAARASSGSSRDQAYRTRPIDLPKHTVTAKARLPARKKCGEQVRAAPTESPHGSVCVWAESRTRAVVSSALVPIGPSRRVATIVQWFRPKERPKGRPTLIPIYRTAQDSCTQATEYAG